MREDLHQTAESINSEVDIQSHASKKYSVRFATKMYTRSAIIQKSKQFASEKLMQADQWNSNKKAFYKLLADKDMEHSSLTRDREGIGNELM